MITSAEASRFHKYSAYIESSALDSRPRNSRALTTIPLHGTALYLFYIYVHLKKVAVKLMSP